MRDEEEAARAASSRGAQDAKHATPFVVIGAVVGLLATATAGFNGAPLVAAALAVATAAGTVLAARMLLRARTYRVLAIDDAGGVVFKGFHAAAIDAALPVRADHR